MLFVILSVCGRPHTFPPGSMIEAAKTGVCSLMHTFVLWLYIPGRVQWWGKLGSALLADGLPTHDAGRGLSWKFSFGAEIAIGRTQLFRALFKNHDSWSISVGIG